MKKGAARLDHRYGVVRQVLAEVIGRVGRLGGRRGVADQHRVPVVRVGRHESVEVVEALLQRPVGEGSRWTHVLARDVIPFAEREGQVSRFAKVRRDRSGRGRYLAVPPRIGALRGGVAADVHAVRVAPGQEGGPAGRADRGAVEVGEPQAHPGDAIDVGRLHEAAEAVELGKADVVEHPDQHVRACGPWNRGHSVVSDGIPRSGCGFGGGGEGARYEARHERQR